MGVPCKQIPAAQEDVSEQGAASRPDTCGDVPSPEDGGGNGHPNGGSMATGMEDEQNLSTRRGEAKCERTPAMAAPGRRKSGGRSRWTVGIGTLPGGGDMGRGHRPRTGGDGAASGRMD